MPRQGQSVETCIITQWSKRKGDPVRTGDILFSYETDKASFDVEAQEDGILLVHKRSEQGVLLPLELLTTTDSKWTYPLEFGSSSKRIGLNLGNSVTVVEVHRMKQRKAANQAYFATSEPAPGAASSAHEG